MYVLRHCLSGKVMTNVERIRDNYGEITVENQEKGKDQFIEI